MADTRSYDYVIVGAGSAGCVLAHRLSADPAVRVCVLEAGGPDRHPLLRVPIGLGKLHQHRMFDWGYDTEPVAAMDGRVIEAMRGKVVGGSSSINVMAYVRGNARRLRPMGAEGLPRLVVRRRAALFPPLRIVRGRRRRISGFRRAADGRVGDVRGQADRRAGRGGEIGRPPMVGGL